jgi:hypothetical protein
MFQMAATTNIQDFARLYADLVEKAWNDDQFLARLQENPNRVLESAGILTPAGATVNVVMRKLDKFAKLADQFSAWEEGKRTGVYDVIIPIKPEAGAVLFPEAGEAGCSCCPCTCT